MRPLPRAPFAGRLCRLKELEAFLVIAERVLGRSVLAIEDVQGSRWQALWLSSPQPWAPNDQADSDGVFRYPFLLRAGGNRILLLAREGFLADQLLERIGIGGRVESPRVLVDRFTRELVNSPDAGGGRVGRRYILGSIYAAVEGYGRSLRSLSFFGDDLAEADLVRKSLDEVKVTRIGVRDPRLDKDLLSISTIGEVNLHFRGGQHLSAVDQLTSYMRAAGYIEWREGASWQAESSQSAAEPGG